MENDSRRFPNLVIVYKSGTSIVGKLTVFPQFSLLKTDMPVGLVKSCLHLHIHYMEVRNCFESIILNINIDIKLLLIISLYMYCRGKTRRKDESMTNGMFRESNSPRLFLPIPDSSQNFINQLRLKKLIIIIF